MTATLAAVAGIVVALVGAGGALGVLIQAVMSRHVTTAEARRIDITTAGSLIEILRGEVVRLHAEATMEREQARLEREELTAKMDAISAELTVTMAELQDTRVELGDTRSDLRTTRAKLSHLESIIGAGPAS